MTQKKTLKDYLDSIYHYTNHLPAVARSLERVEEHLVKAKEPKSLAEMVGDVLREIGVLILVFCVIEVYLGVAKTEGEAFRISLISLGLASFFLGLGLAIERLRSPRKD